MHNLSDWTVNDKLYSPKRKIDNKASASSPHIMGGFFSRVNNCAVEFQSLNEAIFYYLLELVNGIGRYYPQSVEVLRVGSDKSGFIKPWFHVPDVLVFWTNSLPTLFQIKESGFTETADFHANNAACIKLCRNNGWNYLLAIPKLLPDVVISNLNFLIPNLKERKSFSGIIPILQERLVFFEKTRVWELAQSCSYNMHPLMVLPAVWYLLATGVFQADFHKPFSQHSEIWVRKNDDTTISRFIDLITKEVGVA